MEPCTVCTASFIFSSLKTPNPTFHVLLFVLRQCLNIWVLCRWRILDGSCRDETDICLEGLTKATKNNFKWVDVPTEIPTWHARTHAHKLQISDIFTCAQYGHNFWSPSKIIGCSVTELFRLCVCPACSMHVPVCAISCFHMSILNCMEYSPWVKKFPACYGTQRFITVFTSARHLSLSWARSIQTMPPHSTSWKSTFPYEYSENKSHLVGPFRSMPGSLPSSVLLPLIHWEGALQRLALQRSKSHCRLLDDNVITRGPMEVRW